MPQMSDSRDQVAVESLTEETLRHYLEERTLYLCGILHSPITGEEEKEQIV